jgi:hypothetical protein
MSDASFDYETVYCSNGWLEIRNPDGDDQWIATDRPFEIER